MAEENKINKDQTRQIVSDVTDIKREQGDLNNTIKDTINLLKQVDRSYERIEARLETLDKSSININKINQELSKAKQKEFITTRQLSDIQNKLSSDSKNSVDQYLKSQDKISQLEARRLQYIKEGNADKVAETQFLLNSYTALNERQKANLGIEESKLAALIQADKIAKNGVAFAEDKLKTEKEINSSIGITGKVMGIIGKKLGANNDIYADMVQNARELNEVGAKLTFLDKLKFLLKSIGAGLKQALSDPLVLLSAAAAKAYSVIKTGLSTIQSGFDSLTGTGGPISKFTAPFTNLIKQIPVIGGLLGGLVETFINLVDFATGASTKVEEFARNLGISYGQAKQINNEFASFAINSGQAFLNVEKLQNSQLELSKSLGINNILSKEILADNIQLQEQVGLELDTRKQLTELALISNTRQTQIFKSVVGQVAAVKNTLGVNLRVQDVISNISKLTGVVGLTFAKYPEKLAKSLAITKALGLDFQKLDNIASGLLDFESSIAAEFEAQLITGKDINLGKARQLALDNDLTGLAVELNKQLGTSNEFLGMNRIAQESYAKALNMSRDEIADMLRQQELFAAAGATDLKTFKERVAQMEKAGTLQSEFLSKLNEEQAQYFLSSTATEKIANFVEKIRQSFAQLLSSDQFKSFIDSFINKLSDPNFLTGIINKLTGFVSLMIKAIGALLEGLDMLPFVEIDKGIIDSIYGIANNIGTISVGGRVASSQANVGASGSPAPAQAANNKTPQAYNIMFQGVVEDNARRVENRILLVPSSDLQTGNYGKKI